MSDLLHYDKLAEICRNADALAEKQGDLNAHFSERGVDMEGLAEVSLQRAIRAGMILAGLNPAPITSITVVRLPPHIRQLVPTLAAIFVDGFNAGMEAKKAVDNYNFPD